MLAGQRAPEAKVSLVVGADGLIGHALWSTLSSGGIPVLGTSRRGPAAGRLHLDLTDEPVAWRLPANVEVGYLCAAVTSLAACRAAPQQSFLVNVVRTVALARRLLDAGAAVVFLSTNLVFDGSTPVCPVGTPLCPTTEYGRQKAEAERQLLDLGGRVTILRLTKVLAPANPLLSKWLAALRGKEPIRAFSDVVMAPVTLPLAINALSGLAQRGRAGVFQLSAERDVSYAEAARYLASRWGADPRWVEAIPWRSSGICLEAVPAHTTLDSSSLLRDLGWEPPSAWDAVEHAAAVSEPSRNLQ